MGVDPISIGISTIVGALVAGAAAALTDTTGEAIKDAYQGLKSLIQEKFRGNQTAETALAEHEKDPETWEAPLKKHLEQVMADQDPQIMQAARQLMDMARQQASSGGINAQFGANAQGNVVGNDARVNNVFGAKPPEK